ncbi:MAG: hypothetical protein ABIN94_06480 [Ferruginibacter sp.]
MKIAKWTNKIKLNLLVIYRLKNFYLLASSYWLSTEIILYTNLFCRPLPVVITFFLMNFPQLYIIIPIHLFERSASIAAGTGTVLE